MKKFIYAIAAGALMASCIQQGLDAEGQKAWDNFKEISATFETTEIAYDTYETAEDFNAACKAWSEATQAMAPYMLSMTSEQLDSLNQINAQAQPSDDTEEASEEEEEE